MNRYAAAWGAILAASGVLMYFLLKSFADQTFVPSLVSWEIVSFGIISAGILLVFTGFILDKPKYESISNEAAARYFGWAALVNGVVAASTTIVMLVPSLAFPILLVSWPGIYILLAYAFFVLFGVLGMQAWGVMYRLMPSFFSRQWLDRRSSVLQLVLSQAGIYGVSTFLFLGGYMGARLAHNPSSSSAMVQTAMEFAAVPAAVSLYVVIISIFLGVLNISLAKGRIEALNRL